MRRLVPSLRARRAARLVLVAAVALGAATSRPAVAEDLPLAGAEDGDELADLMTILEQETAVATRSRMNADYVPGIVTVLEGDELEALGVQNAWEALALVPGVQPVRGTAASALTVVRGLQFPFNSGNVKLLLDGVPLSRQSSGINSGVLFLPIEQVERIEVIRGPGSVVYGDFAFMGLVNIITRREGAAVHLRADDDDLLSAGGHLQLGSADSPWEATANLNVARDDDPLVPTPRHAEAAYDSAIVGVRRGGFSLGGQVVASELDDDAPPGTPGAPTNAEETTWSLEARYQRALAPGVGLNLTADLLGSDSTGGPLHFEDDMQRLVGEVVVDRWSGQSWLFGVEYADQSIDRATFNPPPPPGGGPPPAQVVIADKSRRVASLVAQDRFELGTRWTVTAGARYDDYSDVGSRVTPRLSLVCRLSEHHILKAQYAEGFRAPTYFESYRNPTVTLNTALDFEINRTTELNYVYRRPTLAGRVTVFRTRISDMVFVAGPTFANTREAAADGIEVEWSQQIVPAVKVIASATLVDTEDDRGATFAEHESESNPKWTSDLALLVRTSARTIATTHWYHVDERRVLRGDSGYDMLDFTFSADGLFGHGLGARLGLRNALDEEMVFVNVPPTGVITGSTYPAQRTVWAQLSWRR